MRKIAAHYIYTPQGFLPQGVITVDHEGVITDIRTSCHNIDSMHGVEFYGGILIPGMVNAHCHLELSYLRGAIEAGGGFAGFARSMRSVRTRFTEQQQSDAAQAQDAVMWQQGFCAVGDICNSAATFDLKSESNIRYINFLELFGLHNNSIEALSGVAVQACNANLLFRITPHSTYSLNDAAFRAAVGDVSTLPLSVHFMESRAEEQLYNYRGDLWDWYNEQGLNIDFEYYGSPARRIVANIPPQQRIMLIHNTFVEPDDVTLLMDHFGDNLTFVLCPRSNNYIEKSSPPAAMLAKMGAHVALGTDSLASNHSISMIEEMKQFKNIPLETVLRWATIEGARALGVDDRYGSLDVGKRSGIVLLSGVDMDTMVLTDTAVTKRLV